MIGFDILKKEILIDLENFKSNDKAFILNTINKFKEKIDLPEQRQFKLSDKAFFESIKFTNDTFDEKKEVLKRYLSYSKNYDDLFVIILKMEYLFL